MRLPVYAQMTCPKVMFLLCEWAWCLYPPNASSVEHVRHPLRAAPSSPWDGRYLTVGVVRAPLFEGLGKEPLRGCLRLLDSKLAYVPVAFHSWLFRDAEMGAASSTRRSPKVERTKLLKSAQRVRGLCYIAALPFTKSQSDPGSGS
jgi:hypothetical protein